MINICDLFMEYDAKEFRSFADDTTPYIYGKSFNETIEKLEIDMSTNFEWFYHNGFKANAGKFHFY